MAKGEEITHKLLKLTNLSVFLDYLDKKKQKREGASSVRYFNAPPKPSLSQSSDGIHQECQETDTSAN